MSIWDDMRESWCEYPDESCRALWGMTLRVLVGIGVSAVVLVALALMCGCKHVEQLEREVHVDSVRVVTVERARVDTVREIIVQRDSVWQFATVEKYDSLGRLIELINWGAGSRSEVKADKSQGSVEVVMVRDTVRVKADVEEQTKDKVSVMPGWGWWLIGVLVVLLLAGGVAVYLWRKLGWLV